MEVTQLLVFAAPVAIAAIGECINEKGGVLNVGLEGTMLVSAFFAVQASSSTGSPWLGMLAGTGVGLLCSLLQSIFVVWLASDQVVVGTAVNLLALGVTGTMFRAVYGSSGELLSVPQIPKFMGIDAIVIFMILTAFVAYWIITKTRWGLVLRACGEYSQGARAAGFSVPVTRLVGLAIGGMLGGVAGAYLSLGISGSFAENMTAGRGFIAIAMVSFGRWNPLFVVGASLLVGAAEALQFTFQTKGWQLPPQMLIALPYVLALLVLVFAGKGAHAPRQLAVPMQRGDH